MTNLPGPLVGLSSFKTAFAAHDADIIHDVPVLPETTLGPEDPDDEILPAGRPRLRAIFI